MLKGLPDGSQRLDVVAHARDRLGPRHRIPPLDVLLDLGSEAELKASAGERGKVPSSARREHWAARERQHNAGAYREVSGVLEREQRHGEAIVHGFGHVQAVVAKGFDALGISDGVA